MTLVLDEHDDHDWKELPKWVRKAATDLGYTKKLWDKDQEPETSDLDWSELNPSQRAAASKLGYTKDLWDDESSSSSSSSSEEPDLVEPSFSGIHKYPEWTIYCIQLYTETKDYRFEVKEGLGIAMYANRPMKAHEPIVQSPVGPDTVSDLFEASGGELSDSRKAFAERFMEWHDTLYAEYREGGQNNTIRLKTSDFYNPPTTNNEHRSLPQSGHFVFDLEIFEHEIVVCEFVSPPHMEYNLPPERRFEVLHYDEGLNGMFGEPGYCPKTMNRPPTVCFSEARSLELPGHFSNHTCGSLSTAYDFVKVPSDGEMDNSMMVTMKRPKWMQIELEAKQKACAGSGAEGELYARKDLEPNEEITSDYSRWHWDNADTAFHSPAQRTPIGFFYGTEAWTKDVQEENRPSKWAWEDLGPKLQWAGTILGYTQDTWDKGEDKPPVFAKQWKKLTPQEREALVLLTGYSQSTWDDREDAPKENDDDDSSSVDSIDDLDWEELSEEQKLAASFVGYTRTTWERDEDVCDCEYFYNLRPEIRNALAVLGQTQSDWEDGDQDGGYGEAEPWFYCICGAPDCHSSKEKGGFKGTKHFPLEYQKLVAPLCEPFVQQQFQWHMYQLETKNKPTARHAQEDGRMNPTK